jgi:pre-mRNA-splicing factor 38A
MSHVFQFKYLRALGAFYLRLTGKAEEIYEYLEPLYNDYRKLSYRTAVGWKLSHMDEFVDGLIHEEMMCDITMPHLPKRLKLELSGVLEPRQSALESEFDSDNSQNGDGSGDVATDPSAVVAPIAQTDSVGDIDIPSSKARPASRSHDRSNSAAVRSMSRHVRDDDNSRGSGRNCSRSRSSHSRSLDRRRNRSRDRHGYRNKDTLKDSLQYSKKRDRSWSPRSRGDRDRRTRTRKSNRCERSESISSRDSEHRKRDRNHRDYERGRNRSRSHSRSRDGRDERRNTSHSSYETNRFDGKVHKRSSSPDVDDSLTRPTNHVDKKRADKLFDKMFKKGGASKKMGSDKDSKAAPIAKVVEGSIEYWNEIRAKQGLKPLRE